MKRLILAMLVAALALVIAAPTASTASPGGAHAAKCKKKKCKKKLKKKPPPPGVTTTPTPPPAAALSAAEVINRVDEQAAVYCLVDPDCFDYGYYWDTSVNDPSCASKTTYQWVCYGWNDEDDGVDVFTCDFREVVERVGQAGITSHRDLTYGTDGWVC